MTTLESKQNKRKREMIDGIDEDDVPQKKKQKVEDNLSKMKSKSARKMYELLKNIESVKDIPSYILQVISQCCAYKEIIECGYCNNDSPEIMFVMSDDEEDSYSGYNGKKYQQVIEEYGWRLNNIDYRAYSGVVCDHCLDNCTQCAFCDNYINVIMEDSTPCSCCDVEMCSYCHENKYGPTCPN
eukprot:338635_1